MANAAKKATEAKLTGLAEWDLKGLLLEEIKARGGWVNAHTHLDRAYSITPDLLGLAEAQLQQKWTLVDEMKRTSTVAQIYDRMAMAIERQLAQGVTALGSFIDVDEVIEDKAIQAATKVREKYQADLELVFINQTLKGVIEPTAREWFERGAEFVDIIGGLPGKDLGREEEHLDIIMETAQRLNKLVHVHVDQLNSPQETETELLAAKTRQHGMAGKVVGIHGISIASHPQAYRQQLYQQLNEAGVMMIACPTAWIDHRRREELQPVHNSVTPVEELTAAGITVAIGTDNIADIYKPFTDGEMWLELRFLLESLHFYDLAALTKIATSNGRKVLGLTENSQAN